MHSCVLLRLHRSFKITLGLGEASCSETGGPRPGYTSALSTKRGSNPSSYTAQKPISISGGGHFLNSWLPPPVLDSWGRWFNTMFAAAVHYLGHSTSRMCIGTNHLVKQVSDPSE